MRRKIFLTIFLLMSSVMLNAQRLGRFTMSKFAAGGQSGVAYPMQKSFFGNLPSDSIHNYTENDTTFYFIYLWLPQPVKELGLQLISPVPEFASAWKGDYEAPDYHDSLKANRKHFAPLMLVWHIPDKFKFINGIPPEDLKKLAEHPWKAPDQLALLSSSSGKSSQPPFDSLVRIGVNEKDTAYAPAGLYQITIKSAGNKKPEGTFVLQVGVTEVIPGLKLFRRKDELIEENK